MCSEVLVLSYRWTLDLEALKLYKVKLVGDCLLGAGFLCYVGAFSWEFRHSLVYTDWLENVRTQGIPSSDPYKLEELLTNDVEISRSVILFKHNTILDVIQLSVC